jgi:ABC-type dipeptide/oligopeptide/nickel transport system permease subunit
VSKDKRWLIGWIAGIAALGIWDLLFLNRPALKLIGVALVNTVFICLAATVFVLILAWTTTIALHSLESRGHRVAHLVISFLLNLIRSIPQVVGVLFGYILLTDMIQNGALKNQRLILLLMALALGIFIFVEVVDLMRERISHFKRLDFYNALLVCGVSERRIVNFDILWKNSAVYIFNKLISVFGMAVFLQCSVDFIISVGLSTDVSAVNFPPTLGSVLAKIDSKQDILAVGHTLTHPDYFGNLFFSHLQGLTVAFLIVFSLLCIHNISDGYAERHHI